LTDTIEPQLDEEVAARDDRSTVRRVVWFVGIVVLLLLIRGFVVEPVRVHGNSMEPTLPAGAALLIDKVTFQARDPHRGDVIVTSDPRTGELIVKRIVATEGDSVGIENGTLIVNGRAVEENYVDNHDMEGFYFGPDTVPSGHVFLLGDNRADSVDSRAFGPVAVDSIDGRVLAKIWPMG
jgi:signal peptidase I